jgi:hypothetical protein
MAHIFALMKISLKKRPRMISLSEFDKLFPERPLLESFTGELVEWFANEANNILGAIDHEPKEGTWSYVVLKTNQQGDLRVMELNEKMKSRLDAETELYREMEAAETTNMTE